MIEGYENEMTEEQMIEEIEDVISEINSGHKLVIKKFATGRDISDEVTRLIGNLLYEYLDAEV